MIKAITNTEKDTWSRSKVLATSKKRFDDLGVTVKNPNMYLHLKRMFLHQNEYTLIRFSLLDRYYLRRILKKLGISFEKIDNRFILDMAGWYVANK